LHRLFPGNVKDISPELPEYTPLTVAVITGKGVTMDKGPEIGKKCAFVAHPIIKKRGIHTEIVAIFLIFIALIKY
jgi:hypothetical protein